jgi:hypothetical protein
MHSYSWVAVASSPFDRSYLGKHLAIHSPTNNNTHSTKQSPEQDPIQQESSVSANLTDEKKNATLPGSDSLYLPVQAMMVRQHTINLQAVCGNICCQETNITSE